MTIPANNGANCLQSAGYMPELKRGETMLATPSAPNRNLIVKGSRMADARSMAILSPKATLNIAGTGGAAGFCCNTKLNADFVGDGFKSPDTYCQYYAYPIDGPAVYAFVVIDTDTYLRGLVAYVGMSRNLEQRWTGHPVLPLLSRPGFHVKRWFKPVGVEDLRRIEREYIQRFDPPWNLQGRKRGVHLA